MSDDTGGKPTWGYYPPDTQITVHDAEDREAEALYARGLVTRDIAIEVGRLRYQDGILDGVRAAYVAIGEYSFWKLVQLWWAARKETRAQAR